MQSAVTAKDLIDFALLFNHDGWTNYNNILLSFLIINNNETPRGLHVARGIVFFYYFFFISCLSTQLFHFTLPLNHSPLRQTTAKQLLPVAVLRRSIFLFFFGVRRVSERCICALMLKKFVCLC